MGLTLTFAPLTDVGRERTENQDAYGSRELDRFAFYIVCDGMGGHRGGSVASRMGVDTIEAELGEADIPVPDRLRHALLKANASIYDRAQQSPELRGMGTTAVVLAVDREASLAWTAHVGDSRLYRVRGAEVRQLTRDHTFVQRLVDDGILTWEAAEAHPQSNVILRSLGGQAEVDPEITSEPFDVQAGDAFVLCSDGLHGLVDEQELAQAVTTMPAEDAARHLVARANEDGGHDNITVQVVVAGAPIPLGGGAFTVARPGPAPGTRLARLAEADTARKTAPRPAAAPPETDEPTAESAAVRSAEPAGRWVGPFVLAALVAAILILGFALFALLRGSDASHQARPGVRAEPQRPALGADGSATPPRHDELGWDAGPDGPEASSALVQGLEPPAPGSDDGSALPSDSSAQPSDGSAQSSDGSFQPPDGSAQPSDGSAVPAPSQPAADGSG